MPTWEGLPRAGKIASYIAAMAGAVVAVGTAWTMLDLPVLASRSYVIAKEARANEARDQIIAAVLDLAYDQRDRLRRSRDALVERLTMATDPQVKRDLQQLVEQANQDLAATAARIENLTKIRGN